MNLLKCQRCGSGFEVTEPIWYCTCGGLLDLEFNPKFYLSMITRRPPGLWRYREAIPVRNDNAVVSMGEGFTPLMELDIDGRTVLVKMDHMFNSGSFKDRGAAVLVSKIAELGIKRVIEDSSGNAGAAMAAYCAQAGIKCQVFVPASTSSAKLRQIERYGAELVKVDGSRDDTAVAAQRAAKKTYYASHYVNPFFFHGTKTFAYEVCEQLYWNAPDTVILPVGNGSLLLGVAIGLREMLAAEVISKRPKLVGIQAEACSPLVQAFNAGKPVKPPEYGCQTMAEGISVAVPARSEQIIQAVREFDGSLLAVSEQQIRDALHRCWTKGFYIEPTSAATIAGTQLYLQTAKENEVIVTTFTGHGLKYT